MGYGYDFWNGYGYGRLWVMVMGGYGYGYGYGHNNAVFMEKMVNAGSWKNGNEYVYYYMANTKSIVATVNNVLLLFCFLTFYTIMPLHFYPNSFVEVFLL